MASLLFDKNFLISKSFFLKQLFSCLLFQTLSFTVFILHSLFSCSFSFSTKTIHNFIIFFLPSFLFQFLNEEEFLFLSKNKNNKNQESFYHIHSLRIRPVIAFAINGSSREHINTTYIPRDWTLTYDPIQFALNFCSFFTFKQNFLCRCRGG